MKYSATSTVMAEVARKRRLRHRAMVLAVPRRSSIVETKYEAVIHLDRALDVRGLE